MSVVPQFANASVAPVAASPVDIAVNSIESATLRLQGCLQDLRTRLDPVLTPVGSGDDGVNGLKSAASTQAPLVDQLHGRAIHIDVIASGLDDILRRLAL